MPPPSPGHGRILLELLLSFGHVEKQLARTARLSIEALHCVSLLHTAQPRSVKHLSALLGIEGSKTSKILRTLEDRGYISRKLSLIDRRVEEVSLTPLGLHAVEGVLRSLSEIDIPLPSGADCAPCFSRLATILANADKDANFPARTPTFQPRSFPA